MAKKRCRFTADFEKRAALDALDAALRFGVPEIFTRNRGRADCVQSDVHQHRVHRQGARLRRALFHGRARPLSRQHLHRAPWRSLKYEAVYLHESADGRDVGSWFRFYGESRPHSSLGDLLTRLCGEPSLRL